MVANSICLGCGKPTGRGHNAVRCEPCAKAFTKANRKPAKRKPMKDCQKCGKPTGRIAKALICLDCETAPSVCVDCGQITGKQRNAKRCDPCRKAYARTSGYIPKPMKDCRACGKPTGKGANAYWCEPCADKHYATASLKRKNAWNKANPEKARDQRTRAEAKPERKAKAKMRRKTPKGKEQERLAHARYDLRHPGRKAESNRKSRKTNPNAAANSARGRSKRRAAKMGGHYDGSWPSECLHSRCEVCDRTWEQYRARYIDQKRGNEPHKRRLERDHIMPVQLNAQAPFGWTLGNCATLCSECNTRKWHRSPEDWVSLFDSPATLLVLGRAEAKRHQEKARAVLRRLDRLKPA